MRKSCKSYLPFPTLFILPKFSDLLLLYFDLPSCSSAMIEEFDLDQDGEINEQEFFAIMSDEL